ncbi:MAG: hypothetical protein IKP54_04460 [Bacteroidales bacterium]|nr:hypothetical protein [Bacteroidales bacterium]
MKTKTIFMLAAMLLMSMGAFAQNNEPLEGDVNNDGTVDVADIVGIIKIMKDGGGAVGEKKCYWYAGTNNGNTVTADNFTDVASQIPESEVPETGSVTANGQYVYFVMPKTKHLESLTDENGSALEFTCTDVMGYHIYKTAGIISGMINYTIEQTIYYWYVGTTMPSNPNNTDENSGVNKWTKLTSTPTQLQIVSSNSIGTWYVAIPSDYEFQAYDSTGSAPDTAAYNKTQITIGTVEYDLFTSNNTMIKVNAIFKQ